MRKGSKFQLLVPSHLAYGEAGAPPQIPANTDLIFDIEVLDIIH
jgi:FKBP-type peptidyl-prolyl cis-trans isomerase FklB